MPYSDPEKQKAAQKESYLRHKEEIIKKRQLKRNKMRRYIQNLKDGGTCADCKLTFPAHVLDFDHLPGYEKKFNIGQIYNAPSWYALLEEIQKCELVCANCHRARTFERGIEAKQLNMGQKH